MCGREGWGLLRDVCITTTMLKCICPWEGIKIKRNSRQFPDSTKTELHCFFSYSEGVYVAPTLFLPLSVRHQHAHMHILLLHLSHTPELWLMTYQCFMGFPELYQLAGEGDAWQTLWCMTKTGWASQAFLRDWTLPDQDSNPQHCYCTLGKCELWDTWWREAVFVTPWFPQLPFPINSVFNHWLVSQKCGCFITYLSNFSSTNAKHS